MELLEGWLQGDDEEALFESMNAILDLAFTASLINGDEDLRDWLANTWFRRIGPHRAKSTFVVTAPVLIVSFFSFLSLSLTILSCLPLNRFTVAVQNPGISREELATIACPVLLVQGTDDMMKGTPVAQEVLDSLIGTDDVSLITVEGTHSHLLAQFDLKLTQGNDLFQLEFVSLESPTLQIPVLS